jgi:mannose-6-phosphate isomerase-like protein (cupin superfamily)
MSYPEARYLGEKGETTAVYRPVGDKADLEIGVVTRVHYLATGASTNGDFGLYRWEMGVQQSGAGAHFHRTITESFFILSGTVRVFNGEQWMDATPGDFVHVPPGGVHGFRNESGEPASFLLLFTPGAPREAYFETLAEIASGRKFTPEDWKELYQRHDQYMV